MIYGEKLNEESGEMEKGVFMFEEEIIEYRKMGWSFNADINKKADEIIAQEAGK